MTLPANPERIVSLPDHSLTVPPIELGMPPVGSLGRTSGPEPFVRAADTATGVDFSNSDIAFVGGNPADLEAVAALDPDVILTIPWRQADVAQLRAIAPTVMVDSEQRANWEVYEMLAEITGTTERLEVMETRYRAHIDRLRSIVDTLSISVSPLQISEQGLFACNTTTNLQRVIRNAGFRRPAICDDVPEGSSLEFSIERLREFDADFIVGDCRNAAGDTPGTIYGYLATMLPGWCEQLQACREDRIFLMPGADKATTSCDMLTATALMMLTVIGGQPFESMPEREDRP